jgi:hypothetical protein
LAQKVKVKVKLHFVPVGLTDQLRLFLGAYQ